LMPEPHSKSFIDIGVSSCSWLLGMAMGTKNFGA